MHIGILLAGIEKRVIGIDLQGHMAISTQNIKNSVQHRFYLLI